MFSQINVVLYQIIIDYLLESTHEITEKRLKIWKQGGQYRETNFCALFIKIILMVVDVAGFHLNYFLLNVLHVVDFHCCRFGYLCHYFHYFLSLPIVHLCYDLQSCLSSIQIHQKLQLPEIFENSTVDEQLIRFNIYILSHRSESYNN